MTYAQIQDYRAVIEYVNFLQRYIIVHSYIYYEMDSNVISDKEYDKKAKELVTYKNKFPQYWKYTEYYQQFGDDYNGATGFTLFHDLNDRQKKIILSIVNCMKNDLKKIS